MKKFKALKKERLPFSWCPGCGINIIATYLSQYYEENDLNNKNTSIISGIGCSGRFAGYFNMDTMHTTHGRAIPVAEGLKLVNPKLNVFVVSGDGDLIGIGLSHLVNAARRNTNLKVICLNNSVYAMTGGQTSPTTPRGKKTQTDPLGCPYELINIFEIVCKPYKRFYARVTPLTKDLFFSALKSGVSTENFAFIEVVFPCYENDYRRLGYKKATEAMKALSNQLEVKGEVKNLVSNQLGIVKDYE